MAKSSGGGTAGPCIKGGEEVKGAPSETLQSFFDYQALDGIYDIGDKIESGKITIDSGAADSVCPKDWATSFKTVPCEPGKSKSSVNASGTGINHYGDKNLL